MDDVDILTKIGGLHGLLIAFAPSVHAIVQMMMCGGRILPDVKSYLFVALLDEVIGENPAPVNVVDFYVHRGSGQGPVEHNERKLLFLNFVKDLLFAAAVEQYEAIHSLEYRRTVLQHQVAGEKQKIILFLLQARAQR